MKKNKTIIIGNIKGGCSKTTIAINICAALAKKNKDVMLVDTDKNIAISAGWVNTRNSNTKLNQVFSSRQYGNIRPAISDFKNRYEYVVIDTAGDDGKELRTGLLESDILIMPFRPSQNDINAAPKMKKLLEITKDYNPDLKVYSLVTIAPTNIKIKETNEAKVILKDYPFKLLNIVIHDRKLYRDSISDGKGVVDYNENKAEKEIETLINELELISD